MRKSRPKTDERAAASGERTIASSSLEMKMCRPAHLLPALSQDYDRDVAPAIRQHIRPTTARYQNDMSHLVAIVTAVLFLIAFVGGGDDVDAPIGWLPVFPSIKRSGVFVRLEDPNLGC
jgi:hypothetical protein